MKWIASKLYFLALEILNLWWSKNGVSCKQFLWKKHSCTTVHLCMMCALICKELKIRCSARKYYGMLEFSFHMDKLRFYWNIECLVGSHTLPLASNGGFSGMEYVLVIGPYDRTTPDLMTLDPTTQDHTIIRTFNHTTPVQSLIHLAYNIFSQPMV